MPVSKSGRAACSWQNWNGADWSASDWNDRAWNDGGDNELQDDMVHGHHVKRRNMQEDPKPDWQSHGVCNLIPNRDFREERGE